MEAMLEGKIYVMSSSNSTPSETYNFEVQTGGRRLRGFALGSVLAAMMLTLLLEALDQTIVGTALPKIIGSLQGFDRYTWVVIAYLLTSTTVVPVAGKLSDQFGRKWFFVIGVVIFLIGSFLAGAAQTMNQLIAFRAIQGLGSGVGIAIAFTVVADIFPPAERVWWQGIFGAVYGFASVVGPTAGGWLADHGPLLGSFVTDQTRWRWVFYVNLPLGLIAVLALIIFLPRNMYQHNSSYIGWAAVRRIDFLGALLASAATTCLLLGLTWWSEQNYNFSSTLVVYLLVGAFVLYLAFFLVERVAVEPILPLGLFRNQVFAADAVLALTSGMVLLGLTIYLPLFLQGGRGVSATTAGALMTPFTFSLVIGAACSGFVIARFRCYQAITSVGAILLIIGVFLLSRMTLTTTPFEIGRNMVIAGVGVGIFFSVLTLVAQNALPHCIGVATSTVTYLRSIGQILGTAIVGAVVNNTISADIMKHLPSASKHSLSAQAIHAALDLQVLTNQAYREMVMKTSIQAAVRIAVHNATITIPVGPYHDQQVATITQQVTVQTTQDTTTLLNQVFIALKQSLALGISQGFAMLLAFCICILVAAMLLKDIPLAKEFVPDQKETKENEESMNI